MQLHSVALYSLHMSKGYHNLVVGAIIYALCGKAYACGARHLTHKYVAGGVWNPKTQPPGPLATYTYSSMLRACTSKTVHVHSPT
jgi:hypothetical protein